MKLIIKRQIQEIENTRLITEFFSDDKKNISLTNLYHEASQILDLLVDEVLEYGGVGYNTLSIDLDDSKVELVPYLVGEEVELTLTIQEFKKIIESMITFRDEYQISKEENIEQCYII